MNRYRVPRTGYEVPGTEFGLTLVELLISLSLVVVVGVTAFSVFSGGFSIWDRVQGAGSRDRLVQLTLEQVRRDLCRSISFGPVGFEGEYDLLSFPGLVTMTYRRDRKELEVDEPGRVGYWFDTGRGTLYRAEHGYRLTRRYRVKDSRRSVLSGVRSVRFSYAKLDSSRRNLSWSGRWDNDEGSPAAVKIEIGYLDEETKEQRSRSLVVPLQVEALEKEEE